MSLAMKRRILLTICGILLSGPARPAPPENADPTLAPWFNSLRQPWTNALCCSQADCRIAPSRLNDGRYEAFIGGAWRAIPETTILNRSDNPTGHAVVCWTPQSGVLCFVRPPES
jgi:hypothetical protein